MGIAGESVSRVFEGLESSSSQRLYRWINDSMKSATGRMMLRLLATEWFSWRLRKHVIVYPTHQGPLIRKGRSIIVLNDFICLEHPYQNRIQAAAFLFLVPRILRNASVVVTISEVIKQKLLRHLPEFRDRRVEVIPSVSSRAGVFRRSRKSIPERIAARHFLFVGANYRHKRLDLAVEAVRRLRRSGIGVRLTAVGVKLAIWADICACGLPALEQEGVKIIEYASDAQLEALYQDCTSLLFLSETEGFGLPPLEALQCGCPAVCNDIPELRESIGDAAVYVRSADLESVVDVMSDIVSGRITSALEEKLAIGESRLDMYRLENISAKWHALVSEVAGVKPRQ